MYVPESEESEDSEDSEDFLSFASEEEELEGMGLSFFSRYQNFTCFISEFTSI